LSPKNAPSGASLALALAVAAILCAPLPALAADKTVLRPLIDFEQSWDSNIYNRSDSGDGSPVTRISPALWIENSGELGHARLGLTAIGRSIWNQSELSGIDGSARGDFERMLTPRLSILGNGLLETYSGYEEIGEPGNELLEEQPPWKRDQLGAGLRYKLTPRTTFRLSGSVGRVNYEHVDPTISLSNPTGVQSGQYRDRGLFDARASLVYQLTVLDELSLVVGNEDTSYQDVGTGSNDTAIWNTQVGWSRNWTPVWSTSATLGLRALDTTQDDVPQSGTLVRYRLNTRTGRFDPYAEPVPLGQANFSNSGTGLIGSLAIQRAFARSLLRFSYDRDTRSTGGAGRTNFDIDSLTLSLTHQLAERVKLTLSGNYSLYHSVTDKLPSYRASVDGSGIGGERVFCASGGVVTAVAELTLTSGGVVPVLQCIGGSSEEKRKYTSLLARIDWQLRRQLNAYLVARYYHALTDQTLGSASEIQTENMDKVTLGVGFRFAWDLGL
jgi:hypothetical protein